MRRTGSRTGPKRASWEENRRQKSDTHEKNQKCANACLQFQEACGSAGYLRFLHGDGKTNHTRHIHLR